MSLKVLFRKKIFDPAAPPVEASHGNSLSKVLSVKDLTFFGIAAVIGGGTFSAIGNACFTGGPGVIVLYIICAIACGFTALCYAEFASRMPVSGSAYSYSYYSFGEIFAWIIGWALLMEYSIGNIYIAFSWSGYFTNLVEAINPAWHIPEWLTINYSEAHDAFLTGKNGSEGFLAWCSAPVVNGLHIIFDLPAVMINLLITALVYVGTKESRNISNAMVILKLIIIGFVIVAGCFYMDIRNWHPFFPNGFSGVMGAVSGVFFAYIGFDAVSTLAEECENPQRDLPKGMMLSLLVCTVIFVILCLVLTAMAPYNLLGVSDPLAAVFKIKGVKWMLFLVSIAAVIAMSSVLLVFQMGQPRIWMAMSRDGLLPPRFAKIHPRFKTPGFATIITGLVVGIPLFFTNEKFVLDFTSIGTLFAFVLVCGGVLTLPHEDSSDNKTTKRFRLPYINGKWIMPFLAILVFIAVFLIPGYSQVLFSSDLNSIAKNIPMLLFLALCVVLSYFAFTRSLSLIPMLGLVSCTYLLTGMETSNWVWFSLWLSFGLIVYFCYGFRKSKLNVKKIEPTTNK